MSRHGVDATGRALIHSIRTASFTTTLPTSRLLWTSAVPIRILGQRRTLALAIRSISSSAYQSQYAVANNTPIRWTGQAAPVAAQLGLRRGLRRSLHDGSSRQSIASGKEQGSTSSSGIIQRRLKSDTSKLRDDALGEHARRASEEIAAKQKTVPDSTNESSHHLQDYLPHIHRPTKEELLGAATGFWHRLQIRFKWFSIRSARPFSSEEIFTFLSWIFWGHVVWIVVGTTTFVSLAIWSINTVFAQETLAGWVGNYLTRSSGVQIVFESAIVPTWKNGVITFNNVFVSRRPGQGKRQRAVSKGSSITAAAAAAQAASLASQSKDADPEDDGNYTQFDVTIQTVNVTLSFTKWFNGKGLLRDVEVHGVRGVVDRTAVHWTDEVRDPKSYRHEHHIGDFEIDGFKMEDVLISVYQPNNFRPFTVSVYNCELPRLRKQWLFYDFMSANNMSGSFDDSLFTVHPRQIHGITGIPLAGDATEVEDAGQWKKHSRLRIDGLKIDHLNRGVEGPFSWIQSGNVDIVADVMIPNDEDGSIVKVMSDFYDRMEATVTHATHPQQPKASDSIIQHDRNGVEYHAEQDVVSLTASQPEPQRGDDNRLLVLDMRVHLNDVRASVPLFTKDLSYTNATLIRPIVAYINSRRAFIPVNCRVVKRQSEFDGSWTIFDSGLLDDMSRETYEAFVRDIHDQRQQRRRIKKVGLWTIQLAAQALFIGLAGQLA